ncbi:cyclic AMP-dependent transcription factor ATF-2 isoform X1 [Patella vulgata]|uniref:cyclic AMP-dependent transcription factor ATF-2 isoform X1 n=1 Tax=Patella vulgata TaxID=6465 RepID=UPI00217FF132|nr:cyclic AMP-dependent transcription factor ATF-2 isoform X1 [Patella vulgata]
MSEDDDKPFGCSAPECGMRFTNEDHLNVHMKKHEMSLALSLGGNSCSPAHHFLDQTPTPTKFLKNCEEIGLFQELVKNPFEEAFKKATDSEVPPLPGPLSNDLNTPIPKAIDLNTPTPRLDIFHHRFLKEPSLSNLVYNNTATEDGVLDLSGKKQVTKPAVIQPSSTTSDDDVIIITTATSHQPADSTLSPPTIQVNSTTVESYPPIDTKAIPKLTTAVLSSPMIIQTSPQLLGTTTGASLPSSTTTTSQPNYPAQVYLQLPSGQMLPVQIPTSISPVVQIPIIPQTTATSTVPIATKSNVTSTNVTLKQRLKQSLQASQQQIQKTNGVSPNHKSISPVSASPSINIPESVSHTEFTPPDSPSELDYDDLNDHNIKRSRRDDSSIEDEDPDNRRRKFLERNRAAAARCRQKRKTWVNSLEKKADDLQNVNVKLQGEVSLLRGEVAQLKTLLLAHKECPVTLQQKSQGQIPLTLHTIPTTNISEMKGGSVIQPVSIANDNALPPRYVIPTTVLGKVKTESK